MAAESKINDARYRGYFIFCCFLLVSISLWLLKNLNNEYEAFVTFKTSFTNCPDDKTISTSTGNTLRVKVRTYGSSMVKLRYFDKLPDVKINAATLLKKKQKKDKPRYFLTRNVREDIQEQLGRNITILEIEPDTIYYNITASRE